MSEDCRNCGRDAGDAFACRTCAETAATDLASIADFARHLDDKRARLGSNWQNGTIGRAAQIPLPYDPRVSKVADPIRVALHGTIRIIWEGCPGSRPRPLFGPFCQKCTHATCVRLRRELLPDPDPESITSAALWIDKHCDWLRRQDVGPEEFATFAAHKVALDALFDSAPETYYVGPCGTELEDGTNCKQNLYVQPGLTGVICPACVTLHQVADRREQLQAAVADYLGTAKEISALFRNQFGNDVSTAMIRGYVRHRLIQSKGTRIEHTQTGDRQTNIFRIGDVREAIRVLSGDEKQHRALRREAMRESVA